MRRNELDLTSQAVRNLITNPAMKLKSAGTDTVLVNYAATPSFEGTSSVTSSVGGNPAQWATSGQATDKAHSGAKSFKLGNCTVAGQAARKGNTATGSMKVKKGQKVSWSFWIYSTAAGNLSPYWEGAKVSDGSYTGGGSSLGVINVPANRWTYCYGTSTASDDAFVHGAGGYNLPVTVGDSVWWDDFCITLTDTPIPYFDGDTPASDGYTYAWSGTQYNSTSIRKAAASVVRTNLVANPTFKGGTLSTVRTNLFTNPSFEASNGNSDVWTNNVMNPSFRATSGNVNVRTNLVTNPSFETGSSTFNLRTNLATNPSFETLSGGTTNVRTNLCVNPRGVNSFTGYGTQTITPNVTITGHPDGLTTANRVTYNTNANNPGVILLDTAVIGTTYTISAWVYHETIPASGTQAFAQSGVTSQASPPPFVQGQWQRFSWTYTATGTSAIGFRVSAAVEAGAYLITGVLVETAPNLGSYFDGTTPAVGDFTYAWTGTANASASAQRGQNVTDVFASATYGISSTMWKGNGARSIRVIPSSTTTADSFVAVGGDTGGMRFGMVAGTTYTFSATCRLAAPLTGAGVTGLRARTITLFHRVGSTGNYTEVRSTQAPNVAGESRVKLTATLPAGTTEAFIRLYNGGFYGEGDIWWDDFVVEENTTAGTYFDGSTPVAKNLANDPRATSNFTGTSGAGWRNTRWFGTGSPAGTYTFVTGASDGPVPGLSTYLRKQWTAAATSNGDTGFEHTSGNHFPVKSGTTYTVSSYLRANGQAKQQSRISISWKDASGATLSTDNGPSISLPYQRWVRNYITATAPATAVAAVIISDVDAGTAWAVGEYLDGTGLMIEEGSTLSFYEDSTLTDFTYAWNGTANASTSVQRVTSVSGVNNGPSYLCRAFQSSLASSAGTKAVRVIGTNASTDVFAEFNGMLSGYTFKANTTYTLAADRILQAPITTSGQLSRVSIGGERTVNTIVAPSNTAGRSRFVVRFTTTSDTTFAFIRIYSGAAALNGEVWFDNMILEEGITDGSYFDGTTPAFENIALTPATALSGVTHTTNVSYGGYMWTRAAVAAGTGGWISRQYADINKLENGATYTASVTVANDQTFAQSVSIDWVDGSGGTYTIAAGETRRISVTGTRSIPYDMVFRFADLQVNQNATQASSILFKDWVIEKGTTAGLYYSGTGDFTYSWTGTAHASTSVQRAPAVVGNVASKSSGVGFEDARFTTYQSTDDISGKKIARWLSPAGTPNSSWRVANINNQSLNYASLVSGATYTIIVKYRSSGWGVNQTFQFGLRDGTSANPVMNDDTLLLNTGWTEYRKTFTALINGLNTTNLYVSIPVTPQATTDGIFDIAEWAIIPGYYTGAFFDGASVSTDSDMSYVWTGTANASTSALRGTTVADVSNSNFGDNNAKQINSSQWSASAIGKSMRIIPVGTSNGSDTSAQIAGSPSSGTGVLVPGKTYTVKATFRQAAPQTGTLHARARGIMYADSVVGWAAAPVVQATNTAGAQTLTHTFTVNSAATWATVRLYNGASAGNGDVWWDDVVLVEGPYTDGYFDGNTAAAGDFSYAWAGTANASQSYQKATSLSAWTKETKLATWITSSGTLRIDVIDPNGGGGRSIVPWSSQDVNLSLTSGKKYTVVARGRKLDSGTGYRVAGALVGEMPFTTSMSTVTLTLTAGAGPVYLEHPSSRNTAGTEWEYFGIFEEGDPIAYFDGDTTGSDGLLYRWKGTPNVSQSEQIGSPVSGYVNESYIRNWALPDGAMRVVNITGSTHSLQTPANIVVSGRQYTVLMRARHYKGGTLKVFGLENTPVMNFNSSYSWVRVSGKAIDTKLYFSTNSGISGAGVDISHLMIVEGTYAGEYLDGNWYNARWDGTSHQSSSVGYPSTLASIAGKPVRETTVAQGNLATSNPPAGFGARTIYFVYETLGTNSAYQGPCTYGTTATGRISLQTQNTGSNQMGVRFDFPGGESNRVFTFTDARLMGTHVIAIALSADMTRATICVDGGTDYVYTVDPGTGWAGNDYLGVGNMSETIGHNAVVYNSEHERSTRLAISRTLANKYASNYIQ